SITAWRSVAPRSPAGRRPPTTSRRSRPTSFCPPTPRTSAVPWPQEWRPPPSCRVRHRRVQASSCVSREQGLEAFHRNETEHAAEPLSVGPFRGFLTALHHLQTAFPAEHSPIRTALVTARSAPAHKRVILTLRKWGVRIDEALFLGGRDKGPFLDAFGADIFFDDSPANVESARKHVATGHVPHGVSNR